MIAKVSNNVREVGKIQKINKVSCTATCKLHAHCVCWVTRRERTEEELNIDLVKWIARASPPDELTENVHWNAAQALKRAYGMVVKPRNERCMSPHRAKPRLRVAYCTTPGKAPASNGLLSGTEMVVATTDT